MLHASDEGQEGQQRWCEGLLQPLLQSWAFRWGKRCPKREMLSWKGQEQRPGVWLQRAVPVPAGWEGKAAIGQQTEGWRFRPALLSGLSRKARYLRV